MADKSLQPIVAEPHRPAVSPETAPERTLLQGLLHYTGMIWARKWIVIVWTAIGAIGTVAFAVLSLVLPPDQSPLPNTYQATASLLIEENGSVGGTQSMLAALGFDSGAGGGPQNTGQIAIAVLNSREFIDRIVTDFEIVKRFEITRNVRTKSRAVVLDNATFNYDAPTGILTISYEDIFPETARDVANAMVENLAEWFRRRGGADLSTSVLSLESKLGEVENEIARLEEDLRTFQTNYGALDPADLAESQSAMLTDLQSQLVQIDVQIRNRRELLRVADDPELARLGAERDNLLQVIREIEAGYTGGARRMPPRSQMPELAQEFRKLAADLEVQQRIYTALYEQYEVAQLSVEFEPVFSVLEYAEVPDEKVGPRRSVLTIQITLAFAFSAVAFVIGWNAIKGAMANPKNRTAWTAQANR